MRIVLKIGGNEIDDNNFLDKVAGLAVQAHEGGHQLILVHGGGKEITNLLSKLNIETKFVNGFRYTDSRSLEAVEMMLSGLINKRLVRVLQKNGVNAVGLSGVDGRILVAKRVTRNGEDIGLVGEVETVNASFLENLVKDSVVVLSPISASADCTTSLNVNADYAASAIASAVDSELTVFLSNVKGVIKDGDVIPRLNEKDFQNLKSENVVAGGMVPKIEAALFALKRGTRRVFIADADGTSKLISGEIAGTEVLS